MARAILLVLFSALVSAAARAHEEGPGCVPHGETVHSIYALLVGAPPEAERDGVSPTSYNSGRGDNDGDGVRNDQDAFPNDRLTRRDSDGDGWGDAVDAFPEDPEEWFDSDADGTGDNADSSFDGPPRLVEIRSRMSDGVYGQSIGFDMYMSPDGHITVITRVRISGVRDQELMAMWEKASEEMWSTDDITFDLQWVSSGQHTTVTVRRGDGRSNARLFYTTDTGHVIAHEMGHHLGLNDEYTDSRDPHRLIGEKDSIMRATWGSPQAYPRHIKAIRQFWNTQESEEAPEWRRPGADQEEIEEEGGDGDQQVVTERREISCPEGYSPHLASGAAWRDAFCKQDGGGAYITYAHGQWWRWVKSVDSGTLQVADLQSGAQRTIAASDLARVVEGGGDDGVADGGATTESRPTDTYVPLGEALLGDDTNGRPTGEPP